MTWRHLSVSDLYHLKDPLIIDVRSPCEHTAESIPGSLNVPLLSDNERSQVGIIYKQQGEAIARFHALELLSPKIPQLMNEVVNLRRQGQPLVVYCWRGGLRSEAVASLLSVLGIDCWRLTGGYKAWRQYVLAELSADQYEFNSFVLDGLTGVGKTELLGELSKRGLTVLDLENLANHRGSVFGGMGLGRQPTQKNFEAALWQALRTFGARPVFMESESRKIGRLALPDCIVRRIRGGQKILVTGSLDARVRRIVTQYTGTADSLEAMDYLQSLQERLGRRAIQEIEQAFRQGNLHEAVGLLLAYYDPLYAKQIERNRPFALEVCGDNVQEAVSTIAHWLRDIQSRCGLSLRES
ncbi:MAG: tRNA 2-selenouridine(34) synthase MnmH [Candidatus Melainabacteria bacterium]|nr:tRNA 2-selenouridine(34) synthase MnmH [Candidatus Melainabacteria bacterium]